MANGVRFAAAADVRGLMRLHARCSAQTLQRRFLSPLPVMSTKLATDLLTPAGGFALLCERSGEVIALITVAPDSPPATGHKALAEGRDADVGLIVSDDWQRRGIGSTLLRSSRPSRPW